MDVVHFREIFHPSWDPTHHPHQLDHCELTIILLERKRKTYQKGYWVIIIIFALIDRNENSWRVNISEKCLKIYWLKIPGLTGWEFLLPPVWNSLSVDLNELHVCVIFWCIIQTECSLVKRAQTLVTRMLQVFNTDTDKTKFREWMSMCHGPKLQLFSVENVSSVVMFFFLLTAFSVYTCFSVVH